MKKQKLITLKNFIFIVFIFFIAISFSIDYDLGENIGHHFKDYLLQMLIILPPIFILIGLFEVWVKKETIIKHLGEEAGFKSYVWVFILAAPMAGGLLPSFPIAYSLYRKGARLSVILVFLGAVGVGRIPMIFFESTFLGWKFSFIRIVASIPMVIIAGIALGKYLEKKQYKLPENQ